MDYLLVKIHLWSSLDKDGSNINIKYTTRQIIDGGKIVSLVIICVVGMQG